MAEYQIFSDGACDIGFAKAKELGIGLIPFYISIDHETYYKEIQEISLEEYFRYMTEEKGYPKTSLPSIQDYMDAFRPALEAGKDIICITMTRTLTASLESAVTAKSMLEEEFPHAQIHVINSWVATGAQALLLMEMARMQKNGKSLNEVITYAEKAREDARIHFMVGDLSYLEIGGRIGKVATISAGLLKIKPIIIFKGRRNLRRRYLPCQKKRTYTDCIHHRKAFQGNRRKSRTLYRNARHKYHLGRYGQLLCSAAGNGSRHGIPASLPDWRDHLHPHRSGDNRLLLRQEIRIL